MVWNNNDGLRVMFPGDDRLVESGEYPGAGATRVIEFEYELAGKSVSAAAPSVIDAPWLILPRNSRIDSVEVVAETAAVGGTSINFGVQRLDGVTEIDHDGLVAALPIANINVSGEKTVLTAGVANAGALVGTTTAYPGYLVGYATGTFTAGKLVVRVNVYVPGADANPTQF